jgi:hypothetical protein
MQTMKALNRLVLRFSAIRGSKYGGNLNVSEMSLMGMVEEIRLLFLT